MIAPRSLKRIRCPQYGHRTFTSISTFLLQWAHLYDPVTPAYASFLIDASMFLSATFRPGVCGAYAPPANL